MKRLVAVVLLSGLLGDVMFAQADFQVTGTPIPGRLLKQNYGSIPRGVNGFDLDICNVTEQKQSLVSSRIYQALASSGSPLQPIGRDIMLAAILHNQSHSLPNILSLVFTSATGVLSVLSASRYRLPSGVITGAALGTLTGQQLLSNLKPILTADQVMKFEAQVLEPALVLDGGSCVERTVFVSSTLPAATKFQPKPLDFHIH